MVDTCSSSSTKAVIPLTVMEKISFTGVRDHDENGTCATCIPLTLLIPVREFSILSNITSNISVTIST